MAQNGPVSEPLLNVSQPPSSTNGTNSDYVVISHTSSSASTGSNVDMGHINLALSMSLQSLGLDMSLEEAIQKIRVLMKENMDLRDMVSNNNQMMKQQYTVLGQWKEQHEKERASTKHHYDQAKRVVLDLRQEVASKDIRIQQLEQHVQKHSATAEHFKQLQQETTKCKLAYDKVVQENALLRQKLQGDPKSITDSGNVSHLQHQIAKLDMEKKDLITENSSLKQQLQGFLSKADAQQQGYVVIKSPDNIPAMVNSQRVTQEALFSEDDTETMFDDVKLPPKEGADGRIQAPTTEEERLQSSTENDLRLQLRETSAQLAEMIAKVTEKDVEISRFQKALKDMNPSKLKQELQHSHEREAALQGRMEETLQRERQEHRQQAEQLRAQSQHYFQEIQKLQLAQPNTCGDVQSLRGQVIQLTQSLAERDIQIKDMGKQMEEKDARVAAYEDKSRLLQDELSRNQQQNDDLIVALQKQSHHLMKTNSDLKKRYEDLSRSNHSLRNEFDQLATDYHTLLKQKQQPVSIVDEDKYKAEIDRLTAQAMGAEDALLKKETELQHMRNDIEAVQVYKAQAEIYRADFEAERKAREDQHGEKVHLQEELSALQLRNQELQDELQAMADNQIAQMQRRHQAQVDHPAYRFRPGHGNAPAYGYPPNQYTRGEPQHQPHQRVEPHQLQARHGNAPQQHGQGSAEHALTEPIEIVCPKCAEHFPDMDSLQLHVMECIE